MSDTATAQPPSTNGKPPVEYEVNEFEAGPIKGYKYTYPSFNDITAAVETYGAEKVLSLLNTQIIGRIRTKVVNAHPTKDLKPAEIAKFQQDLLAKHPGGLLFTQDEATAWRPEVRELSPNQLFKRAKEMFAEASSETDPAKKMELMTKGQQFLVEMGKVMVS